jgi:hypothetical protein
MNYDVIKLNYNDRNGNLKVKASGVVKSDKFFPTYKIDNENYIFKPLSKTKPLTTPLFSYAEVFWSNIINDYFIKCPIYQLAICNGYSDNEPKYYDYGCLVKNILQENEHLVNLLEYFRINPDKNVNIDSYINYCLYLYDYTMIFESNFIKNNKEIGNQLAIQVLLSILRADQNFHYENVSFVCDVNNNILRMAEPIDFEFSTMFLFIDVLNLNLNYFSEFINFFNDSNSVLYKNIKYIEKHYNSIFNNFMNNIILLKENLNNYLLIDKNNFIQPFNSFVYRIYENEYKNGKNEITNEMLKKYQINLNIFNQILKLEIEQVINTLQSF